MKIIVGLGNPGKEYEKTRHNVGFMVLDELVKIYKAGKDVKTLKPQTFMNESGKAVKKELKNQRIKELKNLWVVHDDLDLELGRIKIHAGGSSGHHGIESIIKKVGANDFVKFRVGIGRPKLDDKACYYQNTKDYLLSPFKKDELAVINSAIKKTAKAVIMALKEGLDKAMNEFNS
ncbi:aminoacyl-tRNA hydrolase [Candidatus Gottesmanbacteria bacterium]|nr:aminoacyl-tRNA hydrolase [Candidatus Gottesmanbacteria bacterium]